MVGKCLNLRDFSWRSFWYAILATRGPGKVIWVIFPSQGWCWSEPILWFLQFLGSQWYPRLYKSLSTFLIFHGNHFGMPYLPPRGLGRSSESFFHQRSGVRANHFCDFCNFLCPNGTLGGWKGSLPSGLFLPKVFVCYTCHQGAWEGHQNHYSIITVGSLW